MRVMVIPIVDSTLGMVTQNFVKKTGKFGDQQNQDHTDHSIVNISQNTEKSPWDMSKETQTLVKYHYLVLAWKTRKEEDNTVLKDLEKTGWFGNERKNRDHPDYSIVKFG